MVLAALETLEWLYYALSFWLFLFVPGFRRRVLAVWRQRSGIKHLATVIEVVFSVSAAALPFAVAYALLFTDLLA